MFSRPVRDATFKPVVREAYGATCAITGLRLTNGRGRPEVQAAHFRPVEHRRPELVHHGLALSGKVHHCRASTCAGVAHRVTQRANRCQSVFFSDNDCRLYAELLGEHCYSRRVAISAWCLTPNHIHLILVPPSAEATTTAIADTHRRSSFFVDRSQGWWSDPWLGRFGDCAANEPHALSALCQYGRHPDLARRPFRPSPRT